MSAQAQLINASFLTGSILYVIIYNPVTGQFWNTTLNTGAGGWDTYNEAHWASYAISMTEYAGSGIFSAAYPAALAGGILTQEWIFKQAGGSPAPSDGPNVYESQSQGVNLVNVLGDSTSVANFLANLNVEAAGQAVAGVLTTTQMTTNLADTQPNVYVGRSLYFTSGANIRQVAAITACIQNGTTYQLTFSPVNNAPTAGDTFLVI